MKCPKCLRTSGLVKSVSYTRGIQLYCSSCGHSWEEVSESEMRALKKLFQGARNEAIH
jgi:transposase-like protein